MGLTDTQVITMELSRIGGETTELIAGHKQGLITNPRTTGEQAQHQLAIGGPSRWTGVLIEALNHRSAARMQLGDIRAALADDGWRAIAEANRIEMLAQGLWGVPSFRVEGFEAVWGQDRLWMIEDDLVAHNETQERRT